MPIEKLKIYLHGSKIKPGPIYKLKKSPELSLIRQQT